MSTAHDDSNAEPQAGDEMPSAKQLVTWISMAGLAACGEDGTPQNAAAQSEAAEAQAEESTVTTAEGSVSFQIVIHG